MWHASPKRSETVHKPVGTLGGVRLSSLPPGLRPAWSVLNARFCSLLFALGAAILLAAGALAQPDSFRFVIIGDRTGEARAGVYEQVMKGAAEGHPVFAISVGDTIEGLHDATAEAEWEQIRRAWPPAFDLYLAPGNHDVWSRHSEELFRKYSGHPLHYGFDYGQAHFTVLDNSRSDALSPAELSFLEDDLRDHVNQPLKFIVSHRPSWIVNAVTGDPRFRLQQIAKKYGAQFVIAGHVHQMLHMQLQGIDYISMPSAGGHLRATRRYEDGWFFGYAVVDVKAGEAQVRIHELGEPFGRSRTTELEDWGPAGLIR